MPNPADIDNDDIIGILEERDVWALSTKDVADQLPGDPAYSTVAYRLGQLEDRGIVIGEKIAGVKTWRRADEYIETPSRGVVVPAHHKPAETDSKPHAEH